MKNALGRIVALAIVLALGCCLVSSTISCKRNETETQTDEQKAETAKRLTEMHARADPEKIALLALKYRLSQDTVRSIITEYRSRHDFMYRIWMQIPQDSGEILGGEKDGPFSLDDLKKPDEIPQTIKNSSKTYNTSQDIVASLIIDYKIWTAAETADLR